MTAAAHPPPPLAPRNILEIWATAVLLLRRHPLPFVGSALVLTLAGDLVLWAWSALVTPLTTSGATREQLVQLSVLSLLLGQAVVLAVFALTGALQAVLVVQALTGEPVTIRTALRLLARRIRPVLGVTALLTVVPQLVVLGLIAALGAFFWYGLRPLADGDAPADPAVVSEVLSLLPYTWQITTLPLLVWLMMALALLFAPVTAALEPLRLGGALRRSALLVGNNLPRVLGMLLLELLATVAIVVTFLLPIWLTAVLALALLLGQVPATPEWVDVVTYVPTTVATAAYYAWLVAVLVLLYVDVRVRKEGLAADLRERSTAGRDQAEDLREHRPAGCDQAENLRERRATGRDQAEDRPEVP
ncbi:hypothetical protein AB0K05_10075 [Nonomuraea sp. NPDC049486]|uniref:hypothetical protein n=1 Tax=Nonomuraea sp. NPDC049486 TaxID=3155773 RepID=UPI00341F35F2